MKRRRARSGPRPSASQLPEKAMHVETYEAPDAPPWRFASPATRTASRSGTATRNLGFTPSGSAGVAIRVRDAPASIDDWQPSILRTKVPRSPAAAGQQPGSRPSTAFPWSKPRSAAPSGEQGVPRASASRPDALRRTTGTSGWRAEGSTPQSRSRYNQATSEAHARLKVNLTRFALPDGPRAWCRAQGRRPSRPSPTCPTSHSSSDNLKVGKRHLGKVEFEASRRVEAGNIVWRVPRRPFAMRAGRSSAHEVAGWARRRE